MLIVNYKKQIIDILKKVTGQDNIELEFPGGEEFGDYTTNIAMIVGKKEGKNPRELAQNIASKLKSNIFEKVEVAGPGFINFWLKKDTLVDVLNTIDIEKENYGKNQNGKNKLAIVEYSSANIAKPFTVGHLRSTIIGDAIANLLEFSGWKVLRDNHLGDWGTQFGKQIYAIKTWGKSIDQEYSVKELVDLYVKFHEEAEKDPSIEDEARLWFKKLEDGDKEAREIWKRCIDWSYKEFDEIYNLLGIKFSKEFEGGRGLGESFFENKMSKVIEELKDKKILQEGKEGAQLVFFKNDKYPPAMILKKDGATLYHTRDLATDKYRLEEYKPDLVINEVGVEQTLYFQQLFEMEKMLGWFTEEQRIHIGHGLVRFKEGKMSTRKGNVIWMRDILEEAEEKAFNLGAARQNIKWEKDYVETKSKKPEVQTRKMSELINIPRVVSIGALKYNDLKRDPKTEIIFDWDEILNMEGNSGPYIQYSYARTQSVLSKVKASKFSELSDQNLSEEESQVLRYLSRFPEVIETAAKTYSPNTLCNYLYTLSQKYNTFYNKHKIIGGDNEDFRVALTKATGQVIKNGLNLLGIEAPERM